MAGSCSDFSSSEDWVTGLLRGSSPPPFRKEDQGQQRLMAREARASQYLRNSNAIFCIALPRVKRHLRLLEFIRRIHRQDVLLYHVILISIDSTQTQGGLWQGEGSLRFEGSLDLAVRAKSPAWVVIESSMPFL